MKSWKRWSLSGSTLGVSVSVSRFGLYTTDFARANAMIGRSSPMPDCNPVLTVYNRPDLLSFDQLTLALAHESIFPTEKTGTRWAHVTLTFPNADPLLNADVAK